MTEHSISKRGPVVSVVVPVLNREDMISECIDSLLAMDYPIGNREIIIVDNGSTDGSVDRVQAYGSAVRLLHEATPGPAAARNTGIHAARGEFVAFTDSDCIVASDWLCAILAAFDSERVGAVGGLIRSTPTGNNIEHFGERIHDHAKAINHFEPPYLIAMNSAVRRSVLQELNCFDEGFMRCEDVDLAWRLLEAGYSIGYTKEAVIFHHSRDTLRDLIFEGFNHGVHGTQIDRVHEGFVRSFPRRGRSELSADTHTEFSRPLPPMLFTTLDLIFRSAKWLGRRVGYRQDWKRHEDV